MLTSPDSDRAKPEETYWCTRINQHQNHIEKNQSKIRLFVMKRVCIRFFRNA